jgi:hypothetical protein
MPPEKLQPPELSWLGRLRQRFERFLSGSAPSDPLYLTNRTWAQKLKLAGLLAAPVLILGVLAMVGATNMFRPAKVDSDERPRTEAPPAAPAARPAPDPQLNPAELEVLSIRIARDENPPVVTGAIRNNSNRRVDSAEVSYFLSDTHGSLMGQETAQVQGVGPHNTVTFRAPLKIANADSVLVREVHAN